MSLKQQIDSDLKQALLSGDKVKTTTLRGLKSVILNVEIAQGNRETGLNDEMVMQCLQKEVKKRQEAIDLYEMAGSTERASKEKAEKEIINAYLPAALSDDKIVELVDQAIAAQKEINPASMGKIIGKVKVASHGSVDGAVIARIVKERLQKG